MFDFIIQAIGEVLAVFLEDKLNRKVLIFIVTVVIIGFIIFVIKYMAEA